MSKFFNKSSTLCFGLRNIIERNFGVTINGRKWGSHNSLMSFKRFTSGRPGSGAGKGGGAGGSVRESGGRLGEYGAAQEELYFFNKQKEQIEKLKKKQKPEKAGDMTHKEEK